MKFSLSSNALKLIACATMVIDHVGFLFFPEQILWRVVGRISFPLFAFLIAEGYRHTSSVKRYGTRLFIFALISQMPFMTFLSAAGSQVELNIFFTLCAGLVAIAAVARLPLRFSIPSVILICFAAELLRFDYGAYGVLTILASYLFLTRRKVGAVLLMLLPFLDSAVEFAMGIYFVQFSAVLSLPLVAAYNGERGRHLPRGLFYWFYPVHLLLLSAMWLLIQS